MSDEGIKRAKTDLEVLAELFPLAFTAQPYEQHRPLALGIDKQLVALGVLSEFEARAALRSYVSRVMYNRSCTIGAPRYDLAGNPVGVVTEVEAACSLARLREIQRRRDRQTAASRAARRAEQEAAAWADAIAKARAQRLAKEATQATRKAEREAAKLAAESKFANAEAPAPKVRDGLSALRSAAVRRKAEQVFGAVS
jgi:sRNA-binding protein